LSEDHLTFDAIEPKVTRPAIDSTRKLDICPIPKFPK
jgi:hypothetical protein